MIELTQMHMIGLAVVAIIIIAYFWMQPSSDASSNSVATVDLAPPVVATSSEILGAPLSLPLKQVVVNAKGGIAVIDAINNVYWAADRKSPMWTKLDKQFQSIALNDNNAMVGLIVGSGQLWCNDNVSSPMWYMPPGVGVTVDLNNLGNITCVAADGQAYYAENYRKPEWRALMDGMNGGYNKYGLYARVVLNDFGQAFVLTTKGELYVKDAKVHNTPAVLIQNTPFVDIYAEGNKIYGRDINGMVVYTDNYQNPNWVKLGEFQHIALTQNTVCSVSGNILKC